MDKVVCLQNSYVIMICDMITKPSDFICTRGVKVDQDLTSGSFSPKA